MPAVMSCSLAHAVGSRSGQDAVKGCCAHRAGQVWEAALHESALHAANIWRSASVEEVFIILPSFIQGMNNGPSFVTQHNERKSRLLFKHLLKMM